MKTLKRYVSAIMVAGLLFTTVGCVNDNESASVTELRGSNSKFLQAQAELKSAEAKAQAILADAAKLEAESVAALNKANADYLAAQTAYQNAQTDQAKAEAAVNLDRLKADLEMTIARNANEKQLLADKLEEQKISAQTKLETLKAELEAARNATNAAEQKELNKRIVAYTKVLDEISMLENDIATMQIAIDEMQANLANSIINKEVARDATIKMYEGFIKSNDISKSDYEKSLLMWTALKTDYTTKIEPTIKLKETELSDLKVQMLAAYNDYLQKSKASTSAYQAWSDFNSGSRYESMEELKVDLDNEKANLASINLKIKDSTTSLNNAKLQVPILDKQSKDSIAAKNAAENTMKAKFDILNKAIAANDGTPVKQAAVTTAQDEYNKSATAYYITQTKSDNASWRYYANKFKISNLENQIEGFKRNKVTSEADIVKIEKAIADFNTVSNTRQALYEAYLKANKENSDAYIAYLGLSGKVSDASSELSSLKNIYYTTEMSNGLSNISLIDIEREIENCSGNIENLKVSNESYSRAITAAKNSTIKAIADLEQNLKVAKAERDLKVAELALQKKKLPVVEAALTEKLK